MNGRLQRMWTYIRDNFARPEFLGNDDKIDEADRTEAVLQHQREELERRLRLRGIQASPRGLNE